jgi:uncharacterized protein YbaR (Trm112 family)
MICPECEKELDFFEEETPYGMSKRYICKHCKIFINIEDIDDDSVLELFDLNDL